MVPEGHIVAVYKFPRCTVKISDDAYRDLTPEQIERNKQNIRDAAWAIIRRAQAEGRI